MSPPLTSGEGRGCPKGNAWPPTGGASGGPKASGRFAATKRGRARAGAMKLALAQGMLCLALLKRSAYKHKLNAAE